MNFFYPTAAALLLAFPAPTLASAISYQLFDIDLPCPDCTPMSAPVDEEVEDVEQFINVTGSITTDGTLGFLSLINLIGLDFLAVQFGGDDPSSGSLVTDFSWSAASGDPTPFVLATDNPNAIALTATAESLTFAFTENAVSGDLFRFLMGDLATGDVFDLFKGSIMASFSSFSAGIDVEAQLTQGNSLQLGTATTGGSGPGTPAPIPLPAAGWLLLGGLGALGFATRRKRRMAA